MAVSQIRNVLPERVAVDILLELAVGDTVVGSLVAELRTAEPVLIAIQPLYAHASVPGVDVHLTRLLLHAVVPDAVERIVQPHLRGAHLVVHLFALVLYKAHSGGIVPAVYLAVRGNYPHDVQRKLLPEHFLNDVLQVAVIPLGQHGVATATGAALFGMECTVYMGAEDIERQSLNVFRMEMLGAKVQAVTTGSATLKDATNEAIRTWAERAEDTFYIIGSAVGPHPYPKMVKEFQRIISTEARRQILEKEGRLPDAVVACVGGGSNSIGMFADFIDDKDVKLIGVEAGGLGIDTGNHASAMALGEPGVLHGMKSYLLQDEAGNIKLAHSISAGLDYPGVGPEHAYLRDSGRAEYVSITDAECMDALMELCRMEGIIPAIESAHALAHVFKMAQGEYKGKIIVMCLSGRGDKDVHTVKKYLNGEETNK